jgi:anti-sigma regulatory factor (Ser/Thr protein kinase)
MTAGRPRFVHDAAVYGSDDEFLDIVVPFLRAGVAAREPTLLGVDGRLSALVRDALGGSEGITEFAGDDRDARPVSALRQNWETFTGYVERGAGQVRIVGEIPPTGLGADWTGWAGYEASINHLYDPLPVWAVCPFDSRRAPAAVLADVERTHRWLATPAGRRENPRFVTPDAVLAEHARARAAPFEARRPDLHLADPSLPDARLAVSAFAQWAALDGRATDGLVFAVNEVLANAVLHGRAPVVLRAWRMPDGVTVAVRDGGDGPADPYVGLLRVSGAAGGDGLWLAHEMCDRLTLVCAPGRFTAYLTARTAP